MTARPDAGHPVHGDGVTLYPPAGGVGAYTAVPDRLALEPTADGRPDLTLEVVRSVGAGLILHYGVLGFRVSAGADLDRAAAGAAGPVRPAAWTDGAIRFAVPGRLVSPGQALTGDGRGGLRCTQWIGADAAGLLDGMLTAGVLALDVRAELEMTAVPPRVPATVRFVPARLLAALGPGPHPWAGLGAGLMTVDGDPGDGDDFDLAVAARLRATYGSFAVDPDAFGRSSLTLRPPGAGDEAEVEWDLRAEIAAPFPVVLALDAGAALDEPLRTFGPDAFRRFVDVPPVPTGFRPVSVVGNLPGPRDGAVLGVRLRKPPGPGRPAAIDEFVPLSAPDDRGRVLLRLSPTESPEVEVSTVVHLRDRPGAAIEGPARTTAAPAVLVGPADFGVRFRSVAAEPALLDLAVLTVTLAWEDPDGPGSWSAELDPARPGRTLVLPIGATVARAVVTATGPDGRTARIDLPEPGPIARFHFPFHGANAVPVRCLVPAGVSLIAAEFQPEGSTGTTRLTFTADRPEAIFRWFNGSVFATGYRFRVLDRTGAPGPWSSIRPPGEPVEIDVLEVSGVRFHLDPGNPARVWWEPGPPDAVRTRGKPQIFLTELPGRVAVQVAACLPPTADELEQLRPAVAARLGLAGPGLLQLAPPPGRAGPAELRLPADDQVLASAPPSSTPPYKVLLAATVDGKAADRVRAAIAGERGQLEVTCHFAYERETTVTATCAGDVAGVVATPVEDAEAEVRRLIDAGVLTLTCTAAPLAAPPEVVVHNTDRVVTAAAAALREVAAAPRRISAVVTEVVPVTLGVDLHADVAGWTTPTP
ncbi:hypothetical protein KOI35_30780 [Actinoplanes bogorensis]|uniref:Uncharacterized protein n=1 Tax=Paractinoplanes bogorensis TaxID=1610840 RepID=A0ABS5Z0I3_9ACTN|nr:hypothetical protein [Actinoplanes bogorensis]MBU2667905.1 hypothetical protein [Actinoplanes bogorensis]